MRSGLFLPLFDELADPAMVARLSAEAEEAGWHGVFVWDQLRWGEPVAGVADQDDAAAILGVARDGKRAGKLQGVADSDGNDASCERFSCAKRVPGGGFRSK